MYNAILYRNCTVQCTVILYFKVQCTLHNAMYCIILDVLYTVQYCTALRCIIMYRTILYCIALYCAYMHINLLSSYALYSTVTRAVQNSYVQYTVLQYVLNSAQFVNITVRTVLYCTYCAVIQLY